jgi:xylulokinase
LLLGVDVGTSETKAGLFDLQGNLLRLSRRSYPIITNTEPGAAEQDPLAWWRAVCITLREVSHDVPAESLAALCVQGQGPSVVMIDAEGRPLHNAVLWMDTRPHRFSQELSDRLGYRISPFAHVPMIMWLQRERAELYRRARWFLAAWDYIAMRLCSQPIASTLAYFHPFPPEEVVAAELPDAQIAPSRRAGERIAGLTPSAAEETGLPAGLPVVSGTHDGIATFVGAGLVVPGRSADVNGTSGGLALCWNEHISERGIFSESWIHPGEYIVGGAMAALGKCLDWARDTIMGPQMSRETFISEAMKAPPGAGGLIFLPYLAGERAPIWDPQARGVFFGLTLNHGREHLTRAVLEAVAFALRHVADTVVAAGARIDEMRVCGGQSLSGFWNQVKSDVTGLPVAVPRVREAALMGAAVLAGVGAGLLPDITSGANQMVAVDEVLEPNPDHRTVYSEQYRVYKRLYPDLRDAFHQLSTISHGGGV